MAELPPLPPSRLSGLYGEAEMRTYAQAAIAESWRVQRGTTHSENCHAFGPRHYECALAKIAAMEVERGGVRELVELLTWAYTKLHYRSFDSMEDALKLDEIKLLLMGGSAHD